MATGGGSGFFECTICLEDFQEPKLLPCFHTFCKRCLSSHIEKSRRRNHFPCPNCRTNIKVPDEEADGFQTNFYVTAAKENLEMKLLDIAGGTNKVDCDLFAQLCPKHGNKNQMLQFYCTRCDIPICLHCKLTSHEGHNTKDLDDVIQKATDELKEESNKLQVCILKFVTAKKTAEDTEKKNDKKLQDLRSTIIGNAEELHEMVDNRKTILLDLLTKFEKKKTNKLVQYRKSLDKQRKSLEELGKEISSEKHDIMTLFQLKSTVAEMMNTLKTTPPTYSSNTDEVDYICYPNLRKKAHKMISSFMGQVTVPNLDLPPEHLQIAAAMRAFSSTTYDMPCRTPTLLRKIWAQGRSKYIVRNLSADHNGCLWAIYNPLSPDVELLNKHGATLNKLTIDVHDISGLTFVPDNRLYVCCPSQNVLVKVDDIFSEAPTTNVKMNLPGSPIATCQYNQQVYVLIWGNKRFSEKGIYCPNTSKWLITNFEEHLMRKPFDFVVTKVGRKMTIIVSDPLSKKVFYFQQGKYQYDLLNVFQREGHKQSRFLPRCISLTNKGHLLVADEYNNCVVQLDIKTGKPIGVIHLESIFIKRPRTIRYTNEGTWIGDAYGGLYLIEYDSSNSQLQSAN